MNFDKFCSLVTDSLFYGSLPAFQSEPMKALIDQGLNWEMSTQDTAYVLATSYHETQRYKYMSEIGEGKGHPYGEPIALRSGKYVAYYGRGFVQLTWLQNYLEMERVLGINMVDNPDVVTEPKVAADVIWHGMVHGTFTGKKLSDYINDSGADYENARRVVNGTDQSALIAGYAREFEQALTVSGYSGNEGKVCETCGQYV